MYHSIEKNRDIEIEKQHLHMVKARIEVKISCYVVFMFCDVLLYQMHVI